MLVNVMSTKEQIKIEKTQTGLIGISTAIFMSNKFNILLDAILALDCHRDNVCYFYLFHQHFFQNKKPNFCSVNSSVKVFRMSDGSKNDLFMSFKHQDKLSFVFLHKDELNNSDIHLFPILHESRVLSNYFIKKALK